MRISRHQMYMDMAEVLTRRSTCYRGNVGALLVNSQGILAEGYNGSPSGEEHCQGNACSLKEDGSCLRSDHAERNAITRAKMKVKGMFLYGCTLYCTSAPCEKCAQLIMGVRVGCVFFRNYYKTSTGLDLLKTQDRPLIYRLTPSGYLINERTGMLEDA